MKTKSSEKIVVKPKHNYALGIYIASISLFMITFSVITALSNL